MTKIHVTEIKDALVDICKRQYEESGNYEKASKAIGVSKSTFWRWLNGKVSLNPVQFIRYFPQYEIVYGSKHEVVVDFSNLDDLVKKLDVLGYELVIRRKAKYD